MVSIISIGIEKYENKSEDCLNDIPCAYNDARRVYDTFEKILAQDMKKYSSASLKDVTTLELRALLSALQLSVEPEDIFVLYFSGHGLTGSNGKLKLAFSDYGYSEYKGLIAVSEILSIVSNYHCKIVLILDCCYSGSSLLESNKDDIKLENCISILTSDRPISKALYNTEGSEFTKYLCESLEKLYEDQIEISLDNIYNKIFEKYKKCQIVTGGGNADVVFTTNKQTRISEDFGDKFINKINSSNYELREALWYALGYFPEPFRINLLVKYRAQNGNIAEMSWRVRRAIGSICRTSTTESGRQFIWELINSSHWMEKCIGYISVHKIKDEKITENIISDLKDIEKNHPMDLVWLLMLYLSERKCDGKDIVLKTNLMKTTWGAIEIWKRYYQDNPVQDYLDTFKAVLDDKSYKMFCLELFLRGKYDKLQLESYPKAIKENIKHLKMLYGGKSRGSFEESKINKWIFSVLYGNWRDQMDLNIILEKLLKNLRQNEKNKFLRALKYLPSVEIKMAILDFFVTKFKENKYKSCRSELEWALSDEHPWVIRTALPLFQHKPELVKTKIKRRINMNIYPGVFDLAIELARQGLKDIDYEIENMTYIEEEQLSWAKMNE